VVGLASSYNLLKLAGGSGEISYGLKRWAGEDGDVDSDLDTGEGCLRLNAGKASRLISLRASGNEAVRRRRTDVDAVIAGTPGLLGELLDSILVTSDDCCCSGSVELVVELAVVAGPRLVPALRGFAELVTVLIGLFVMSVGNSRSRLCFDLQVPSNARGWVFLPFLVGAIQSVTGMLPRLAGGYW
jgi:hypothetical protein